MSFSRTTYPYLRDDMGLSPPQSFALCKKIASCPMVNFLNIPLDTLAIQIPFWGQPSHLVTIYIFTSKQRSPW